MFDWKTKRNKNPQTQTPSALSVTWYLWQNRGFADIFTHLISYISPPQPRFQGTRGSVASAGRWEIALVTLENWEGLAWTIRSCFHPQPCMLLTGMNFAWVTHICLPALPSVLLVPQPQTWCFSSALPLSSKHLSALVILPSFWAVLCNSESSSAQLKNSLVSLLLDLWESPSMVWGLWGSVCGLHEEWNNSVNLNKSATSLSSFPPALCPAAGLTFFSFCSFPPFCGTHWERNVAVKKHWMQCQVVQRQSSVAFPGQTGDLTFAWAAAEARKSH